MRSPPHFFVSWGGRILLLIISEGRRRTLSKPEFEALHEGVVSTSFCQSVQTWVHPGHGFDTTLGPERPHFAEWFEHCW